MEGSQFLNPETRQSVALSVKLNPKKAEADAVREALNTAIGELKAGNAYAKVRETGQVLDSTLFQDVRSFTVGPKDGQGYDIVLDFTRQEIGGFISYIKQFGLT